ncbi:hypothetical protein FACS1894219_03270 [Clostridia bacterium]|nr:hypothetical protein FACS1894219_03270 [Clostridia bacterium]
MDTIQNKFNAKLSETAPTKQTDNIAEEKTTKAITGQIDVGDRVIPVTEKAYSGLIGHVMQIDKTGTDAHDTDNPGDDVHVDFTCVNYKPNEISAIEANFAELYGERKSFYELPLDDVIMAPEMLVSLTGSDIEVTDGLTESLIEAMEYASEKLNAQFAELEVKLKERIENNYNDYNRSLLSFGQRELIDMAAAIHAYSDCWSYLTEYHTFSDAEIKFLMQFDNPLEIVADARMDHNIDVGDVEFSLNFIMEPERQKSMLETHPQYSEKSIQNVEITITREADLTPKERLEKKMEKEFGAFIRKTERKPAHEILESAYQKVFMEDILLTVKDAELSDEQIDALLSLDTPLADLYWDWLDCDVSYIDTLRDCVNEYADAVVSERRAEQAKAEQPIQHLPVDAKPPAAESTVKQPEIPKSTLQPAKPPVKPKQPDKQSILAELDAAIIETHKQNAVRMPQTHKKSKNKEIE